MTTPHEEFSQGQARVLSNTTYLLAASFIQKFLSLGYFVYYVRVLGPSNTGLFEPVRSVIPIALVIIDFSFATVLTREIARTPTRAVEYVNNALSVKLLLAFLALIATLGINAFVTFDQMTRTLLFLAGIVIALDMFTLTYTAALRGIQIFRYEAISIVLTQLATVATGMLAFHLKAGIPGLMLAFVGGSLVNFSFMLTMFHRKFGAYPRLAWHSPVIRKFFVVALPILGAALLAKLFTYADRFLLLGTVGKTDVGIYVAAHKAPFAIEFIAATFASSLLPAMSRAYVESREHLSRYLEQGFRFLLLVCIPITVGIFVLAHPFIIKLFGTQYREAIVPLRIMILALPFIFLNFPVGSFLIATNRQNWNIINLAIAVVVNLVANILLQPKLGATGAAVGVLASYFVLFTLGVIQAARVSPLHGRKILLIVVKVSVAAIIMAVPLLLLQRTFSPYFLVIPGGMIYVAALFMLGGLEQSDLRLILRIFSRKTA